MGCLIFFLISIFIIVFLFLFKKTEEKNSVIFIENKMHMFLSEVKLNLLEVNSNFSNFRLKLLIAFLIVLRINYLGLIILIPQLFLNILSVSLICFSFSIWIFTYSPTIYYNKTKTPMSFIGHIIFPSLSILLSNIELLTHLFRQITLTSRL